MIQTKWVRFICAEHIVDKFAHRGTINMYFVTIGQNTRDASWLPLFLYYSGKHKGFSETAIICENIPIDGS